MVAMAAANYVILDITVYNYIFCTSTLPLISGLFTVISFGMAKLVGAFKGKDPKEAIPLL
jgi:hypothetical protein